MNQPTKWSAAVTEIKASSGVIEDLSEECSEMVIGGAKPRIPSTTPVTAYVPPKGDNPFQFLPDLQNFDTKWHWAGNRVKSGLGVAKKKPVGSGSVR